MIAIVLCAAAPAHAVCPSLPDDQTTSYVENRTALALCQQRELAVSTEFRAFDARIEAELGNLEIELRRQRILHQQMIADWPAF